MSIKYLLTFEKLERWEALGRLKRLSPLAARLSSFLGNTSNHDGFYHKNYSRKKGISVWALLNTTTREQVSKSKS